MGQVRRLLGVMAVMSQGECCLNRIWDVEQQTGESRVMWVGRGRLK